jgi:hypothetical protein
MTLFFCRELVVALGRGSKRQMAYLNQPKDVMVIRKQVSLQLCPCVSWSLDYGPEAKRQRSAKHTQV